MNKVSWAVVAICLAVSALSLGYGLGQWQKAPPPKEVIAAAPTVPTEDRVIAGGRKYKDMLGKAYANAWTKAADALDRNVPLGDVMIQIGKDWQAGRDQAYGENITPVLIGVVPEGTPDKNVTATQRAQLASGFRRFAIGLSQ